MASGPRRSPAAKPSPTPTPSPRGGGAGAWLDATFHFLSSVKLAVITIAALVVVLSYATFYEKWYGTQAVGEDLYKSPGFALILTFLGVNILCAALSRLPWKRRHLGFVVTHAGLIVVLIGTFVTLQFADEGMVQIREGETAKTVVRADTPQFLVRPIDPDSGRPSEEFRLPFRPGTEVWNPARPDRYRLTALAAFHPFSLARVGRALMAWVTPDSMPPRTQTLRTGNGPFKLEVIDHIPAARERWIFEEARDGAPMAKLRALAKPPNAAEPFPIFLSEPERWLVADGPFRRTVSARGPAEFSLTVVDRPEDVSDFLQPPPDNGFGALWFHYVDSSGKPRRHAWTLDAIEGGTTQLPDSAMTVTLQKVQTFTDADLEGMPPQAARFFLALMRGTGTSEVTLATMQVQEGNAAPRPHLAFEGMPAGTEDVVLRKEPGAFRVGYVRTKLGEGTFGRFDLLADAGGKVYYRTLGRDGLRKAEAPEFGESIAAFGGGKAPMSIDVTVEDYLASGQSRLEYEPIPKPLPDVKQPIQAAKVRMTVGSESREFWLLCDGSPQSAERVEFPGGDYEVAYDVRRHDLDFQITLNEFEVGFDPGTKQPASYESRVKVADPGGGPASDVLIEMNEPYTNGSWTFYQASFAAVEDPRTRTPTGEYSSVLQARYDPPWCWGLVYGGCALVVLGIVLQFTMRAGVFSDTARRRVAALAGGRGEVTATRPDEL